MKPVTITIPAEHIHSVAQALKERVYELEESVVPHMKFVRSNFKGPDAQAVVDRQLEQITNEISTLKGLATLLLITGVE